MVTEATCTSEGVQRHDCENCVRYETAPIPTTDHHFVDGICEDCGAESTAGILLGDANGDGEVDYLDAMMVAQYYVGDLEEFS